eukprot:6491735-Amphidinium_carterae.3
MTGNQKVHTVPTGVETITALCMAIPPSTKGAMQYQLTQLKKFMMENGFGGSIVQENNEPAIVALAQSAAKELSTPWRTSAPYEKHSQRPIDRLQKTLFTQMRAIQFDLVPSCGGQIQSWTTGQCSNGLGYSEPVRG